MITPDQLLAGNESYVAGFADGDLTAPPRRRLAIVARMDARMEPMAMFGLGAGDAHVTRNAGGALPVR